MSTVVSTRIDDDVVRAVAGRGDRGASVMLETIAKNQLIARAPISFDGVSDAAQLDVSQLVWRTDRPGALVFHLGANICHLERGETTAKCVIARGGGRPSR